MAMERDNFSYKGIGHTIQTIYSKEGIKSFYSGITLGIIVTIT